MNCQNLQSLFPDFQTGNLPPGGANAVRAHLEACPACRQEWAGLEDMLRRLDALPSEEPSPRLREKFQAMLAAESAAAYEPSNPGRASRVARLLPFRALAQFVTLAAALAVGFLAGQRTAPAPDRTALARTEAQIAVLQQQIDSMNRLVSASLEERTRTSAADRLQAVLQTRHGGLDESAVNQLIHAATNDPSINVRLSALEALFTLVDRAAVRRPILESLPREHSPLVQLAMIDFLAAAPDPEAAVAFDRVAQDIEVDASVRRAAQRALSQF